MPNFRGEMRPVIQAADAAGYDIPETRKIVDGSLFSEADIGLLANLKESLGDSKQRALLLDILESRKEAPVPLRDIIDVLEKFSRLQDRFREELTSADIQLLQFAIHYFENWFYRGEWANVPQRADQQAYNYLAVPAGIVNMLTKIKELPEYTDKIGGFETKRLAEFRDEVRGFAENFLRQAANAKNRQAILNTFRQSENSVNRELAFGSKAADLYFLKTCLIAAEMARRQDERAGHHVFIPDKNLETERNQYEPFDFSPAGNTRGPSVMHYPTHRLPYCKFVVEYLRAPQN